MGLDHEFSAKLQKLTSKVRKRLDAYIKNPDEKNVHDIRTALRTLRASLNLLPKKLRLGYGAQIEQYKIFFRLTSRIRDLDIVWARISGLGLKHLGVRLE